MRNLEEIRVDIDKVDSKLKELFIERMGYINEVYLYKDANNIPVKNQQRENEIIEKRTADLNEYKNECAEFFKTLMDNSCKYQEQKLAKDKKIDADFIRMTEEEFRTMVKTVAYQGILGSYGSEMAKKYFGDENLINKETFREVCVSVKNGESEAGVLPIENLSAGSVSEVYDLIEELGLNIVMAKELEIDHCLLGTGSLSDVVSVLSHSQALMQCSSFISENNYEKIQCVNTAIAAKRVAEAGDPSIGVICNKINADYYNLNLLKENISDIPDNKTRFIVISSKKIIIDNPSKISMVFSLPHKTGSLARVLSDFSMSGFNLSKIESRPIKSNIWEYLFFVDIEGSLLSETTRKHLENIAYLFDYVRIIGNY